MSVKTKDRIVATCIALVLITILVYIYTLIIPGYSFGNIKYGIAGVLLYQIVSSLIDG